MSFFYNRAVVAGNLTKDPEIRDVGQSQVCTFSVAINERYKAKDGTLKEDVTFLSLEAWGKTAQFVAQYFKKGDPIFVEGKIKVDQFDDKDGKKQYRTKIRVDQVSFCGGKKKDEPAQAAVAGGKPSVPATVAPSDEDPPF